mmetsp:Transcript_20206/g.60932  ORF Transcript_20206/g.60932 Transcript_20206/m.60932 type:complete len:206 (-) Transcript_20206:524-1141(-)
MTSSVFHLPHVALCAATIAAHMHLRPLAFGGMRLLVGSSRVCCRQLFTLHKRCQMLRDEATQQYHLLAPPRLSGTAQLHRHTAMAVVARPPRQLWPRGACRPLPHGSCDDDRCSRTEILFSEGVLRQVLRTAPHNAVCLRNGPEHRCGCWKHTRVGRCVWEGRDVLTSQRVDQGNEGLCCLRRKPQDQGFVHSPHCSDRSCACVA